MPSKYRKTHTGYRNHSHSGKKAPPTGSDADLNLSTLSAIFADEEKARDFLEAKRWPDGIPYCPHCGKQGYALTAKPGSKKPGRPGLKKCTGCRKQFSVRVGTIFEESKIPISKWLMAIHLMTSSKKGISSRQLGRELGITSKSAWFVSHRIREAMRQEPMASMLKGTVEADETYIGGKTRHGNRGRGSERKTPVVALIERGGRARAKPVEFVTAKELGDVLRGNVDKNANLMTDEFLPYVKVGKEFASHGRIRHKSGIYSLNGISTNSAESFFALLKRGHYGTFHCFSRKHTARYCDEFCFRWDRRKITDGERMVQAIEGAEGKRLMYNAPIGLTA